MAHCAACHPGFPLARTDRASLLPRSSASQALAFKANVVFYIFPQGFIPVTPASAGLRRACPGLILNWCLRRGRSLKQQSRPVLAKFAKSDRGHSHRPWRAGQSPFLAEGSPRGLRCRSNSGRSQEPDTNSKKSHLGAFVKKRHFFYGFQAASFLSPRHGHSSLGESRGDAARPLCSRPGGGFSQNPEVTP